MLLLFYIVINELGPQLGVPLTLPLYPALASQQWDPREHFNDASIIDNYLVENSTSPKNGSDVVIQQSESH